jgi:polysaccharide biosynthesis/export protein
MFWNFKQLMAVLAAIAVPLGVSAAEASSPSSHATTPAAQSAAGADYVIGPGDTLQIFVWRNPELTVAVPVRPDGKISTPLVEDMVAVGKSPTILARDIEVVLGEYVKSPQVNVIVTQPASAFSQVKVMGQVQKPQALAYREGMTVLDAILATGGVAQFAAANRTKVVRTTDGKSQEIKVRLKRLLDEGDLKENVMLKPGDVLIVPESRF